MTKEELIRKSIEIYGAGKYSFEKTEIKRMKDKVTITCSKHGDFEQDLSHFIYRKQGCPLCNQRPRYTTEAFIEKCIEKRGIEENIDYSKTIYNGHNKKTTFICKEHGEFQMTPSHFLGGEGCPVCRYIRSASKQRGSLPSLIEKAKNIHGDKYDYSQVSQVVYRNYQTKIPIICHEKDENGQEHGMFWQAIGNHISSVSAQGCPICGRKKCDTERLKSYEQMIQECNERHQGKYQYINDVPYVNAFSKLHIICPTHGDFYQKASNHRFGQGCPLCFKEKSHIEQEVLEFIKFIYQGTIIENDRDILKGKEIDIFLPEKHIGFEVDGLIWHSEKFEEDKNSLINKTQLGEEQGIHIIHIYEDEWNSKKDICKSRIQSLLNLNDNKIYARKCNIVQVDGKIAAKFLNDNHLQGNVHSPFKYGLEYNGELVSLMTFGCLRKNLGQVAVDGKYEMLRFCNKIGITVVGGASKLLNHFIQEHNPKEIISYADRRWSNGNLYKQLKFQFVENTRIGYYYVINKKRYNRFMYRKDVLVSKYNCPPDKTEHQFCLEQGWYRIYDCGCKKYSLKITNNDTSSKTRE